MPIILVQPKVLFFPDEAPLVGQELITISKDDPAEFSSISTSNSVKPVQTIQSRIGSKFYKFKKQFGGGGGGGGGGSGNNGGNGEHGNNQLQPFSDQDILQRIGSVLGIAGLGILFIAEVSSSFGAPILIPFFAIPLGLIVLLRLAYSNEMLAATMGNGGSNPHECLYFCSWLLFIYLIGIMAIIDSHLLLLYLTYLLLSLWNKT